VHWTTDGPPAPAIPGPDTSRPHPARVHDYLLGGKDNFRADRRAADAMIAQLPGLPAMTRANRDFLHRAVDHLVHGAGVRQFLDIGSGIPTARNVHEIALTADPTARVVYVDNDPVVAAHSRALLTGAAPGSTAFVEADATDPAALLADPALTDTLDLSEPVALMLVSVLVHFPDRTAHDVVASLLAALPPGSHLVISHPTTDFAPEAAAQAVAAARRNGLTYVPRSRDEVAALFAGTTPVEPGIVPLLAWRPAPALAAPDPRSAYYWAGVARR
jgi:SAM-dependent methyltransferase